MAFEIFLRDLAYSPVYTLLAPVRHILGALLFRDAAAVLYHKLTGKRLSLGIFSNLILLYLVAELPDLDGLLGVGHRDVTHSLAFAVFIGLAGVLLAAARDKRPVSAAFVLPFAVVLSHVFVDLFIEGGDPMNPLWPLMAVPSIVIHPNYELVGYVFIVLGLAYVWWKYRQKKQ
jgi:membrane-bound metal-dependent hydrolase YbcI (DUF457 family)